VALKKSCRFLWSCTELRTGLGDTLFYLALTVGDLLYVVVCALNILAYTAMPMLLYWYVYPKVLIVSCNKCDASHPNVMVVYYGSM
jgi:hypothetical protein